MAKLEYRNRIELLPSGEAEMGSRGMQGLREQTTGQYYRLTAAGKRQLVQQRSRWQRLTEAMAAVLGHSETEP